MQRIKKIIRGSITRICPLIRNHVNQMRNRSNHKLNFVDDSRTNFHLRTFKREHLISYKKFDSLAVESLNMKNAFDLV